MCRSAAAVVNNPSQHTAGRTGQPAAVTMTHPGAAGFGGGAANPVSVGGGPVSDSTAQPAGDGARVGWVDFTAADVDPAVLSELPFHVQREVMQAMRERGQPGRGRGGFAAATGGDVSKTANRSVGRKGPKQNGRARSEQGKSGSGNTKGSISRFFQNPS
jgi:hypothetical protein